MSEASTHSTPRPRRLATVVLLGLLVLVTLLTASYLTFGRSTSTGESTLGVSGAMGNMNMSNGEMSASSCDLISPIKLESLLGALVAAPTASTTAQRTTCSYALTNGSGNVVVSYDMNVSPGQFFALSTAAAHGAPLQSVGNLGDAAYVAVTTTTGNAHVMCSARHGSNAMILTAPLSPALAERIVRDVLPAL